MVITLLLFGSERLPDLARSMGKSIREFKKATSGLEEELRRALETPPPRARPGKCRLRLFRLNPRPSRLPAPLGLPARNHRLTRRRRLITRSRWTPRHRTTILHIRTPRARSDGGRIRRSPPGAIPSMADDAEPVHIPITGELDLHTFRPVETASVVAEYLSACHGRGLTSARIIHGKSPGALRETVHVLLHVCRLWNPSVSVTKPAAAGGPRLCD